MPKLLLSEKDLPETKSWKNGKTYDLIMTVKQTKPYNFEIMNVESPESAKEINVNDYTDAKLKRLQEKASEY